MNPQFAHPADLTPSKPAALHIDQAMLGLGDAIDTNTDVIRELLRRIEPLLSKPAVIVGTINSASINGNPFGAGLTIAAGKAPLAIAIEDRVAGLATLTKEVRDALAQLQI